MMKNILKNKGKTLKLTTLGFTLIELLAVIVILAIIALIATPVVLNIINDARESSKLRSADFYLDAVEYTIVDAVLNNGGITNGTYYIMPDGNLCKEQLTSDKTCPETDGKSNILKVEVNGEKPKSGTIEIANGNINDIVIELDNKTIVKNEKGDLIYHPCILISGDKNTLGSKYECEVKPGTKYNFYVLSQEDDGTTNLIMDRNICEDGTPTDANKEDKCLVAWVLKEAYVASENEEFWWDLKGSLNDKGPITAMNYLYKATKDWSNIPNIVMDFVDNGFYGSIITTNNETKITTKGGQTTARYSNLKARMPSSSELYWPDYDYGSYLFLYENLDYDGWSVTGFYQPSPPTNSINGIFGYWALNSYFQLEQHAWALASNGSVYWTTGVTSIQSYGVRPVISLKL